MENFVKSDFSIIFALAIGKEFLEKPIWLSW